METLVLIPALVFTLILLLGLVLAGVISGFFINELNGNKKYWLSYTIALVVFIATMFMGYNIFSHYADKAYNYYTYLYETKIALDSKNTEAKLYKYFYKQSKELQDQQRVEMANPNIMDIGKYGDMFQMNDVNPEYKALYFDVMSKNKIIILYIVIALISMGITFIYSKKIIQKDLYYNRLKEEYLVVEKQIKEARIEIADYNKDKDKIIQEKENEKFQLQKIQNEKLKISQNLCEINKIYETKIIEAEKLNKKVKELKEKKKELEKECTDIGVILEVKKEGFNVYDLL